MNRTVLHDLAKLFASRIKLRKERGIARDAESRMRNRTCWNIIHDHIFWYQRSILDEEIINKRSTKTIVIRIISADAGGTQVIADLRLKVRRRERLRECSTITHHSSQKAFWRCMHRWNDVVQICRVCIIQLTSRLSGVHASLCMVLVGRARLAHLLKLCRKLPSPLVVLGLR